MSTISVSLPADGTNADVTDYNTPITTIINEMNGGLNNANIAAAAAIDGSKLADAGVTGPKLSGTYKITRQDNTTNSTESTARVLTGWGLITPGVATIATELVTFNSAFTSPPIVMATYGGDTTGATSTYGSGAATVQNAYATAILVTATTFTIRLVSPGGSWAAGNTVYYQWIAIGV